MVRVLLFFRLELNNLILSVMKNLIIISILAFVTLIAGKVTASDYPEEYLGLPGDNLNLYATMKLFQESETLEDFERSLNDQNSHINNLDLNEDNLVDYIMVMDYVDNDVHTIVLRTELNDLETQDIAVFTVQRFNDGSARIQLIGDEALYGKNYIVEPIYADSQETPNPGYIGNTTVITTPEPVVVTTYQVAAWPIVRFIYDPGYICWRSSWRWGYYPSFWNPWRPYYWHTYYGYHSHFNHYYFSHYRYWNHYRYHRYHDFYYGRVRSYSPGVNDRIREGNYRTTYSRPDLRSKGDDLYRRTARRSTDYRADQSTRERTNSTRSVRSRSNYKSGAVSERGTVTRNSSRTRAGSASNSGTVSRQKSANVRSGRTTANSYPGSRSSVTKRAGSRSGSSYRTETGSPVNVKREARQKSTTVRSSRSSGSVSANRSYRQPTRSSSVNSQKSATKPSVSPRSSNPRSTYRQPKVSSRSNGTSNHSYRQPKVSSRSSGTSSRSSSRNSSISTRSSSRPSGVSSRSHSSGSRGSGSIGSRSSHSRSSSGGRSRR